MGTHPRKAGEKPPEELAEDVAGLAATALAKAKEADGAQRRRILARLFKALDEKMMQIEDRIAKAQASAEPQSAADAEREARALSSLAGLYAKLVALDEAAKGKSKKAGKAGSGGRKEAERDAEQFREDLARRLRRLNRR